MGSVPPVARAISENRTDRISGSRDQLAVLRILAAEAQTTTDAVGDAQQAETIVLNRYQSGLVS